MQVITTEMVQKVIVKRPANSHKGQFGRILIIGGNQQYGGAAMMSAEAAVNAGAGLVTVMTDQINLTSLHARLPEAMFVDYQAPTNQLAQTIRNADVIVIGPGLGLTAHALMLLQLTFKTVMATQTLLVDGSALTLVAKHHLPLPNTQLILTPHQMEWSRLSQLSIAEQTINANQQALAPLGQPILVLKKHHTEIYHDQSVYQLTIGTPALATGGSGDTLTGIIAAFCGQFQTSVATVNAAVYTHSAISDQLAQTKYVTLPTQIIQALPAFMAKLSQS